MRKTTKLTIVLLLSLLLGLLITTSALAAYSGSCGDNVSYALNEGTGELHIYGSGAMYDYDYVAGDNAGPWSSWKNLIKTIRITVANNSSDQITWLGNAAFANLPNLTNVNIYTHNTSLGTGCFRGCTSLTHFLIVDGVDIGDYAFYGCSALNYVSLNFTNSTDYGTTYNRIGSYAFTGCTSLKELSVPPCFRSFGTRPLGYTTGQTKVSGFTIKSLPDCAAYNYAVDNGFNFALGYVPMITSDLEEEWAELGDDVTFYLEDKGGETYSWYSTKEDGTDLRLETDDGGPSYTVTATADSANRSYYCVVKNSVGQKTSASAMLYVDLTPYITYKTFASGGFVGDTAIFRVEATGVDLSYQWYYSDDSGHNWKPSTVSTATKATLKVPVKDTSRGRLYKCIVSSPYGEVDSSLMDPDLEEPDACQMIVLEDLGTLDIDLQRSGTTFNSVAIATVVTEMMSTAASTGVIDLIFENDEKANYDLDKVGKGDMYVEHEGVLTYRFHTDDDYTNLTGYYTMNSTQAMRRAMIEDGCFYDSYSALRFNFGTPFRFTVQPTSQAAVIGKKATFHAEAQGDGVTYEWQVYDEDMGEWNTADWTGWNTDTMQVNVTDMLNHAMFKCIARNTYGDAIVSDEVTLTCVTSLGQYVLDLRSGSVTLYGDEADLVTGALYYGARAGDIKMDNDDTYEMFDMDKDGKYDIGGLWNYDDDEFYEISVLSTCSFSSLDVNFTNLYPYGGGEAYTSMRVLVGTDLHITGQPQDFYGKEGSTVSLKVQAVGDGLTYQWWYKKADGTSFQKSTLAAGKKATFTMAMQEKYDGWQYYCKVTDKYGRTAKSKTVTIHYATPLKIVTQPQDFTGHVGDTVKFTVVAEGEGLTYQWYVNKNQPEGGFTASTLASGKKATYSMTLQAKHDNWVYYCKVTDKYGKSVNSRNVTIHVDDSVRIVTQPQDFYGNVGDTVNFTVVAEGTGLIYQWYYCKPGETSFQKSTLASGKKATYTMTMQEKHDGWQYYCVVTDGQKRTARSDTVTIHLGSPFKITTQPVDYVGAAGSTVTFKVVATGDGLTYQWYYAKGPNQSFSPSTLASGKKATYTMTLQDKHNGWRYYCKVSDSHGHTLDSNEVSITVATPLSITTQPKNYTGAVGDTAKLKVVATGDGLTYQWYCKKTGETSFSKSTLASATTATLSLTLQAKHDGYQYYCKVKDSHGSTVNSNTVKISIGTPLKITTQPTNFTGTVGTTAKFKVVAQGDGLTYQWYCKKTGETSFSKSTLASATTATLSLTLQAKHDGYQYYCKVKDSHGNTVNSSTVKVIIGTPLKITTQPANFTGAVGATAKLKVVAQGDGLTYQWYCKKTGETSFSKSTLSSATTATLSLTLQAKHEGYKYYCIVKDSHGNSVKSNTVTIHVN